MSRKRILIGCCLLLAFSITACEDLLEVPDISEEEVQLLAPSDSTTVVQTEVNFTWNEVFEATQYHVQVAAPGFENAAQIVVDTVIVVDSLYAGPRFSKSLTDSAYEWRVKAQNSGYETDFSLNRFTVETSSN